jgi:hypothetical protein
MPGAAEAVIEPRPRRDPRNLLHGALEPVIAGELHERGLDVNDVIGRLQHAEGIAHAVTTLLGA